MLIVVFITTIFFASSNRDAQAAPQTLGFTARLKNSAGSIVADGLYNVSFSLYNASEGGASVWSETYYDENGPTDGQDFRVKVANGYLSVNLGSRTAMTDVNWEDDLYLTMNIGGTDQIGSIAGITWDGEMSPRIQMTATPYSMNSGRLNGKTADDLIHNSTSLQDANFNISGTGSASVLQATEGVVTPSVDRADAGTLTIGGVNATSIHMAQDVTIGAGKSLTLAGGSTTTRPTSPTEGTLYFDTTTKQLLVFANGKWQGESKSSTVIVASSNSRQSAKDGADFVADNEAVIGVGAIDGDQVQINNAIASLPITGGTVYLTEGVYYLDASIILPDNVTLSGAGAATILTVNNGFNSGLTMVTNSNQTSGNINVEIRDLTFHGNRTNVPFSNTINATNFNQMGNNVGSTSPTGLVVTNTNFTSLTGNAVSLFNSKNSRITNNIYTYIADMGVILNTSSNNHVTNNIFTGSTMAIQMYGATHSTITGNTIDSSTDVNGAIEMRSGSSYNTITGNTIRNSASNSLRLATSSSNIISSNLFTDNGGTGANHVIWIAGNSDDNMISRNTLRDTVGTGYAINIDSASANRTYLDGNSLSGTGANTINNIPSDTIFAGQQSGSGNNYVITAPAGGSISLLGNTSISGALNATSLQSNSLDTSSPGTLTLGGSNASSISLGQNTALAVDKTLSVNGETTIKSGSANSTGAFSVQNTGGVNQFNVDTANNRVNIGTPDTTGTLLVVDTKTSSGDPAGTNGAMYYNSVDGKFRCFENGAWADCVTPLPISKVVETSVENLTDTAADVEDLTFTLDPGTKYYYKFMIMHEAALETTGIGFGITAPNAPKMSNWCVNTSTNLASATAHWGSYCGVGDASATTTGSVGNGLSFTSTMEGYIETDTSGGDLVLRFKSQSNASTTVLPGSFGILQIVQ